MAAAEKAWLFSAYRAYPEEFKTVFLYFKTYLSGYLSFHFLQATLFDIFDLTATSAYYVMPVAFRPVQFISLEALTEIYTGNNSERFHEQKIPVNSCQVRFFNGNQIQDLFRAQGRSGGFQNIQDDNSYTCKGFSADSEKLFCF